jgi:hypothetical protein
LWENIFIDGRYLVSSPPYSFSWNTTSVANGSHTILANAYDNGRNQVGVDSVAVNVAN